MGKSRKKDSIIFIILLIITIIIVIYATYLFYTSFKDGKETILNYNEKSNLTYKVWLKENNFYSDAYLSEEYNVIASAIDKIEIDFDYLLNTSNYIKGTSYYTINSKILAYQKDDSNDKKVWDYEKLIKDKIITKYDQKTTTVQSKDNFKINYQEYKKLMEDYQKNYGVSLIGNLIIEINIKTDLQYSKFKNKIDLENRKMTITIPLTDPVIKITKDELKDSSKQLIEKADSQINYLKLILSLFCFLGGIGMCIFLGSTLVKILGFDSKYVRKLTKILRTYNSIIVSVEKININNEQNIMNVSSFDELLDAQSELRVPILYCNIKNNKEALFAIKYDKELLTFKMKSDLYEKKSTKDKSDKS